VYQYDLARRQITSARIYFDVATLLKQLIDPGYSRQLTDDGTAQAAVTMAAPTEHLDLATVLAVSHDRPRHLVIATERDAADCVRLAIRDVGVGIDAQSMNKLFDAFYTTKTDGMGIGLSVSRSIIERHKGRLWAEPNDGPGVTFAFTIPTAPEAIARQSDTKVQ
jgi:signal transduction histidine kinase